MPDLITFLRARLDETEERAREATPGPWHALDGGVTDDDNEQWPVAQTESDRDRADRVHIAHHDPARVLREVEAKRETITAILRYEAKIDGEWGCCHGPDEIAAGQCEETNPDEIPALRILAMPDADHPDYLDKWRNPFGN